MKNPNTAVGETLRAYRKSKGMTLVEFADKIHKSKATVSKYEKGEISLDISTLIEISDVLQISPARFLEFEANNAAEQNADAGNKFFNQHNTFYIYFFDGRVNKMRKNMIKVSRDEKGNASAATLFFNLKDFDNPQDCKALYYGTVTYRDLFMYFYFDNQSNNIEKMWLCAVNPLERGEYVFCMLSGISSNQFFPSSVKCILSDHIIADEEKLKTAALLSKDEIKTIKQLNMFTVCAVPAETENDKK